MTRKYSVHEINELRQCLEHKYLFGWYFPPRGVGGVSKSYNENTMAAVVESRLQTHMLAGHTAEDLMESERTWREAFENGLAEPEQEGERYERRSTNVADPSHAATDDTKG